MTSPRAPSGSYENGGGSFGRDLRLAVGAILVLGNIALMYVDARRHEVVTWQDVALHGGLLLAGLLLMDPKRTIEIIGSAKGKIPFIGGGK